MGKSTLEGQTCKRKDVSPINVLLMVFLFVVFCSFCYHIHSHSHFHLFPLNGNVIVPKGCPMITLVTYIQYILHNTYIFDGSLTQRKPLFSGQRHKTYLQHHKHHIHTVIIIFRCNKTNRHPSQAKRNRKTLMSFYLLWHLPLSSSHSVMPLLFLAE